MVVLGVISVHGGGGDGGGGDDDDDDDNNNNNNNNNKAGNEIQTCHMSHCLYSYTDVTEVTCHCLVNAQLW